MKLIKARTRGLRTLTESRWFDLSPHLNLFQFPAQNDQNSPKSGGDFLRILETINPTYICKKREPFADLPKLTEQGGYLKRVNPTKRTVALAVFSATPELVGQLTVAGDWFYETDRIEVGRRLDYSRWINFVELASSTRWSEISSDIKWLIEEASRLEPDLASPAEIICSLRPSDRIKDELQDQLANWLRNLPAEIWDNSSQLLENSITTVMRADHFQTARDIVRSRLPLFVVIGSCDPPSSGPPEEKTLTDPQQPLTSIDYLLDLISNKIKLLTRESKGDDQKFLDQLNQQFEKIPFSDMKLRIDRAQAGVLLTMADQPFRLSDEPLCSFKKMQANVCLALATSRVVYRNEPILLFNGPEQSLSTTLHSLLADFVIDVSKTCQCLYSYSDVNIFPEDVVGRRYSADELFSMGE